jgi:hypothetical protein
MARSWVIVWAALFPLLLGAGPPLVKSAAPAPDLDALFDRADGWTGADGAYSVVPLPKRILWLFSDTRVGKIRDGGRSDATIVNNTVGMQGAVGERVTYTGKSRFRKAMQVRQMIRGCGTNRLDHALGGEGTG